MTNLATLIESDRETWSVKSLNQRWLTRMTGAEIAEHDFNNVPINILCIQDGGGYLKGHFYWVDDDGEVHDAFKKHTHTSSQDGGSYYEILRANYKNVIGFDHSAGIVKEMFNITNGAASRGTVVNQKDTNEGYIKCDTGNVANDYINLNKMGGRIWFHDPLTLQLKYGVSHDVDSLVKMGVCITDVQNASGNGAQLLFEFCSGGGNTLIGICTADGTDRTTEYLSGVVQAVPFGLRADWYPSSKVYAIDGNGNEVNKTTDIPAVGSASTSEGMFKASIKSTNTTPKTFRLWAARLVAHSFDSSSGIKGWV